MQELLTEDNFFALLDSSDSEEDQAAAKKRRRANKERNHLEKHEELMRDYFNEDCTYSPQDFSHRFRMERGIFLQILNDLTARYPYFLRKPVSILVFFLVF